MNILFVTSNRIGDAVLSTGLLGHLIETRPAAGFVVACGPLPAPLFAAAPGVRRVIAMEKRPLAGHWLRLWREAATTLWDLVVDLRGSGLAWTVPAKRRRVLRPARTLRHRVRHIADLFALAEPPAPRLWLGEAARRAAAGLVGSGGPVLAVAPTANWPGKEWPAERFVAAIERLTGRGGIMAGSRVAVLGAGAERDAARPVLDAIPAERRIDLVGTVPLDVAAACLARAALFVGNDSGLMHVAAAGGVPTLGLFGPSRDELYAPWGPHCAVVRTTLSHDEIAATPGYDPRKPDNHMATLAVDDVVVAAEALWRRSRGAAA